MRPQYPLLISVITLFVFSLLAIPSETTGAESVLPTHGRALSLRVLQERVQACQPRRTCDEVVLHLAGLKRLQGYVVDEDHHDLVLIGQVEPAAAPALHLQDLVIALRDAWKLYVVKQGNRHYVAEPGVSIDPHAKVIAQLQRIGEFLNQASGHAAREQGLAAWHATCHLPQQTRVEGIPFATRFSATMLAVDAALKRWVDGSVPLAIAGFRSLSDLHMEAAKQAIHSGKAATLRLSTMSRFWFYPQPLKLKEHTGIALIDTFGLQLLTEEEHLNTQGHIVGKGAAAPLAAQWAQRISRLLPIIGSEYPMIRDLENLAWHVALARTIKFRDATAAAGLSLEWLLTRFEVPETPVPRSLPGHSNVDTYEYREAVAGGYVVGTLLMPSCGGVQLAVKVDAHSFHWDRRGQLARLKQVVRNTRPGRSELYWDL